jgi:type I restriction enzyme S subunit
MSNIEDLLKEYCPNGVEYVELRELFKIRKGGSLTNEEAVPGIYPVVTASRGSNFTHDEFNYDGEFITISSHGAYAGHVSYFNEKFWLGNNVYLLESSGEKVSVRFYLHVLKSLSHVVTGTVNSGGIPYINAKDLLRLSLPKLPIQIQLEIVSILDKFTQLEDLLQVELEARRIQYEHYRHKLLSCEGVDSQELELGSFGRVLMCKRIMKNETSITGDVPFFKIGTFGGEADAFITREKFEEFKSKFSFPRVGSLLISAAGTIGKIVQYDGQPSYFQDSNIVWLEHDESVVLNDYLFHCYKIAKWNTDTGSIPRLYNSSILKLKIKVPSIDEQKRIAGILGKFETLTNDAPSSLSAEIVARRQQYEYYRSKLITFKELEVA